MLKHIVSILCQFLIWTLQFHDVSAAGFCCSPSKWTANVRTLRQEFPKDDPKSVKLTWTWQTMNYDAVNQRVAIVTFSENDAPVFERQVLDYAKGEQYVIEGETHKTCVRHPLTKSFKKACVPEGTTGVYFAGIASMSENTVYFTQPDVTGYVTVTLADCAFVQAVTYGSGGDAVISQNVQYMNQTLSVDPSAFKVPDNCRDSQDELVPEQWQKYSIIG
ncbi:uncharacterized protein [Littorina saxatilis]|uniref:Uncharacterized protein n=1 Tax=Littorina saxatilis TaxID=31220 RepID=A0AAN9G634_9CAEN